MGFFKSTVHVLTLLCAEGLGFSQMPSPPQPATVQVQSTPLDAESVKHGIIKIANDQATIVELYDPSKKILLVGNRHDSPDMQDEMARSLPGLHDKGIKKLGLECDEEVQVEIDKYTAGKLSRDDLIDSLGVKPEFHPEKYVELVDEAQRSDMKVSCFNTYDKPMEPADQEKLKQLLSEKVDPLMAQYNKAKAVNDTAAMKKIEVEVFAVSEPVITQYRNSSMATNLDESVRKEGPVVMFVGGMHLGRNRQHEPDSVPGVVEESIEVELLKLPSANDVMSILLRGGRPVRVFTESEQNGICRYFAVGEECWAQKNNRANDRYVRMGLGDATYILHLPEMIPAQSQGRAPQR